MSDSGQAVEELLANFQHTKYNLGFLSKSGPTPETLKNYLDVSVACFYLLNQPIFGDQHWPLVPFALV